MTLTVIATTQRKAAFGSEGTCTLRLTGAPEAGDRPPANVLECADRAGARLKTLFPDWLWHWAEQSGALSLTQFRGPISWWWYSPLSEMSPIRSPLIRELYWVFLLREVLRSGAFDRTVWLGSDRALASVARQVAVGAGVAFEARLSGSTPSPWKGIARRAVSSLRHIAICVALRVVGVGPRHPVDADSLLYTRYPVLWERTAEGRRERMFADWPAYLALRGHRAMFAATYSGSVRQILINTRALRDAARRESVILVEAMVPMRQLITAHLEPHFLFRYWRWRRSADRVTFDGLDISEIFRRELDATALSPEIPFDRVLAESVGALLKQARNVRIVFFPFEYQPMERAVTLAAHNCARRVVGLQTGLFTSNQMGFTFPAAQMRLSPDDVTRAPLPDALSAYGDLPFQIFAERLGPERVLRVGPIRYSRLSSPTGVSREAFLAANGVAPDTPIVAVTTSTVVSESMRILEASFEAASRAGEVVLALKFHYHLPLHEDVRELARRYPNVRHRIFEAHLDELLTVAIALVCGGSSTAFEAIARECMPLAFRAPGDFLPNPILETPEAAFFWSRPDELYAALEATLTNAPACAQRRAYWPEALRRQLWPLTADMNARLYGLLEMRGMTT